MSETWTEYGWRESDGTITRARRGVPVEKLKKACGKDEWVVGRTVTASDWLPVDGAQ